MAEPMEILAAFQGGGAKGIAYVGAIRALETRGYTFKAVSGTSAGSIVAALLAAGFSSAEMGQLIPQLLARLTKAAPPLLSNLPDPRRLGHYSLEGVRELLESSLRAKLRNDGDPAGSDVTFEELHNATGIELNILITSAPGIPTVLNVYSAPECQVSYAVAASSAIPFVMNPQLLTTEPGGALPDDAVGLGPEDELLDLVLPFVPAARWARHLERVEAVKERRAEVSRVVVDGGVWANYPGLCFTDKSVRYYHHAPDLDDFPMVGFVLDPTPDPADPARKLGGFARLRSAARPLALSALELILALRVVTFVITGLVIIVGSAYAGYRLWSGLSATAHPLEIALVVAATMLLAWIALFGLGLGMITSYLPAAEVALGTLIGGLTSVSVRIPPWVGAHPSSRIIGVPASSRLISTTSFTPTPETVQTLIDRAEAFVGGELDALPLGAQHAGRRAEQPGPLRFIDTGTLQSESDLDVIFGWGVLRGGAGTTSPIGSALDKLGMR